MTAAPFRIGTDQFKLHAKWGATWLSHTLTVFLDHTGESGKEKNGKSKQQHERLKQNK
jgi:hypothetical protein